MSRLVQRDIEPLLERAENKPPAADVDFHIASRDQAEAAGAQIVALTLQIDGVKSKQNRAEFAAQKHAKAVQGLFDRIARYKTALQAWANNNRDELLKESKSIEMRHVTLSFRRSPPFVRLLPNWEIKAVIQRLFKSARLRQYVRVKHELDRQRLLADSRSPAPPAVLAKENLERFGLEITQEENFFVEPKLTSLKA